MTTSSITKGILGLIALSGACHDDRLGPSGDPQLPEPAAAGLVLSNALPLGGGMAAPDGIGVATAAEGAPSVVYVSLAPGTVPNGQVATVRSTATVLTLSLAVVDGGFDPVAIAASVGDSVEIVIRDQGGAVVLRRSVVVPPSRPPTIVRTEPPRKKRDVPLNQRIVIVFSEPIAGSSLNSSTVRLYRGTALVAGEVRLLNASGTVGVLEPTTPLSPNSDYRLEVTKGVRDLSGEALEADVTVDFTTGETSLGPPASIQLSPDSILNLLVELLTDISATVRDAAGNVLIGHALSWSSSDSSVAEVWNIHTHTTGAWVYGVRPGSATITASDGPLSATAFVTVRSPAPTGVVAAVRISPASLMRLPVLDGRWMTVSLLDVNGRELTDAPPGTRFVVTLASTNLLVGTTRRAADLDRAGQPDTITSNSCGTGNSAGYPFCPGWNNVWIQPLTEGTATLIATSEGASDTAFITVWPRREVASVRVVPSQWTMQPQDTLRIRAHLLDAAGTEITPINGGPRPITWAIDNAGVAAVDTVPGSCIGDTNSGLGPWAPQYVGTITRACAANVSAHDTGSVAVTVSTDGVSATSTISVPHLAFASLSAGGHRDIWYVNDLVGHTCGITVSGVTVCWGGDRGATGDEWSHYSTVPWELGATSAFRSLSAGELYTCGLTAAGDAYCWSSSIYLDTWWDYWELGRTSEPSPVPGGHTFVALDAGAQKTCGFTATGTVYCWDWSTVISCDQTAMGIWYCQDLSSATPPEAVVSPHRFAALSVGGAHACGLTSDGTAYCWGTNTSGQLGDGSFTDKSTPVAVGGGHSFVVLEAGTEHTCGLVAGGAVYCWGSNAHGQLGGGAGNDRAVPARVGGGHGFVGLSAGGAAATTCGITAEAVAHCWGHNEWGQVGDGTTTDRLVPTPVAGGLAFASVTTGERHTCAVTTTAVAYCWGWNVAGQLGDGEKISWGSRPSSSVPVRVAGQP